MKEDYDYNQSRRETEAGLHVICLSSGGGPSEENVTGFLVRSVSTQWAKNSVLAVDAGSHMSAITKILETDFPLHTIDNPATRKERTQAIEETASDYSSLSSRQSTPEQQPIRLKSGPFAGLPLPFKSARANSLHFVRECVSTYLITHPHLDHICALVINTAAFHNTSRPKRLAALPSTVSAIKTHVFNDVIWPNLTDEDGGVGFVTFQRLAQGGNIAVGEGSGKGYIEVCDGLCVRGMKISHGNCIRDASELPSRSADVGLSDATVVKSALTGSGDLSPSSSADILTSQAQNPYISPLKSRCTPSLTHSRPSAPVISSMTSSSGGEASTAFDPSIREVVVDSTAYFIRDDCSKHELLFFGDVEPDAISWAPRTYQVWQEAAPKVASGALKAIVIECSYDDSQEDAALFGHLAPRHLVKELAVLAELVRQKRAKHNIRKENKKRKRYETDHGQADYNDGRLEGVTVSEEVDAGSRNMESLHSSKRRDSSLATDSTMFASSQRGSSRELSQRASRGSNVKRDATYRNSSKEELAPLVGMQVMIMHMKDTMNDGPLVGDSILRQLKEHELLLREGDGLGLGCDFVVCRAGASYFV